MCPGRVESAKPDRHAALVKTHDGCAPADHVILLDDQGRCHWASTSLTGALGFNPAQAGSARLDEHCIGSSGLGLSALATALAGDAGAVVRVRTASGGHAWFRARGVAISGSAVADPMLLVRMSSLPVDEEARAALRISGDIDALSGLLTRGAMCRRLAHPASEGDDHRAVVVLQAGQLADTPWGATRRRWGQALGTIGKAARASAQEVGHEVPVIARIGLRALALTLRGVDDPSHLATVAQQMASHGVHAARESLGSPSAAVSTWWMVRQARQPWAELLLQLPEGAGLWASASDE